MDLCKSEWPGLTRPKMSHVRIKLSASSALVFLTSETMITMRAPIPRYLKYSSTSHLGRLLYEPCGFMRKGHGRCYL